jgi:hypothetical protein
MRRFSRVGRDFARFRPRRVPTSGVVVDITSGWESSRSPDGQRLVCTRYEGEEGRKIGDLWLYDVASGESQLLLPRRFDDLDAAEQLLPVDVFPLGSSWDVIAARFEWFSEPRSEGHSRGRTLTDATLKVVLLGEPAQLEMNFANGRLYSYYFRVGGYPDYPTPLRDAVFDALLGAYGEPHTEFDPGEIGFGGDMRHYSWCPGDLGAVMTEPLDAAAGGLVWGWQERCAHAIDRTWYPGPFLPDE